jgi:hypothetical protein
MKIETVFTPGALVGFGRVQGWDEAGQYAVAVKTAAAKHLAGILMKIRAFSEHEVSLDDVFKVLRFFFKFHVFQQKPVAGFPHKNKLFFELYDFFLKVKTAHLLREVMQGRDFRNYAVNYIHHALEYSAAEGGGQ